MEQDYSDHSNKEVGEPTRKSVKESFADSLISEPPTCPECAKISTKRSIEKCDYCGFHYGYLRKFFPKDLPTLEDVNDFSGKLSKSNKKSIQATIKKTRKKYPQLHVKVATLPLQRDVEVQQMALWMLNESPLHNKETQEDRLWTILLFIDTASMKSCFATGYKMEVFFPNDIALKLVLKLNTSLRNYEDLSESIEQILNELILNLDHSKRVIKKHLKQFKKL